MYNFNLENNESINSIIDEVLIRQGNNERVISVAVTNKRILFLDYQVDEFMDSLNGAHASSNIKPKEVFFYRYLNDIKEIKTSSLVLKDDTVIEFDNKDLFKVLKEL